MFDFNRNAASVLALARGMVQEGKGRAVWTKSLAQHSAPSLCTQGENRVNRTSSTGMIAQVEFIIDSHALVHDTDQVLFSSPSCF